jgi:RNA polymerase primary sigma factor
MSEANDNNSISLYFKDIDGITHLKRNEEYELAQRIQDGDEEALNKLVTSNLKFVVMIAKEYTKYGVPLSDLISEGNIGLIRAAKKFDKTKGVKFISYAVWWIRNSLNECVNLYKTKASVVNIDLNGQDEYKLKGGVINQAFEEDIVQNISSKGAVDNLLKCLKEREVKILSLYFGLYGEKEQTLNEISDTMGITAERTRQILHTSLNKLKVNALCSSDFKTLKEMSN